MNFAQPLYAKAQQASKIYTRIASKFITVLLSIDYIDFNSIHTQSVILAITHSQKFWTKKLDNYSAIF